MSVCAATVESFVFTYVATEVILRAGNIHLRFHVGLIFSVWTVCLSSKLHIGMKSALILVSSSAYLIHNDV